MTANAILITGGTGFLGRALVARLLDQQQAVTVLSRDAHKVAKLFGDQVTAVTRISALPDAGQFKAIINLAGAGIFDQRWTAMRKQILRSSRIQLTEQLVAWIATSKQRPELLISGSAIGYYGNQADTLLTEASSVKTDFSQQLCADWEIAALQAESLGVRVCLIRTGLVLGLGGGVLQRMLLPFRLGLGGRLGNGQQWMAWIHINDWLAIVLAMLAQVSMQGAYNAVAPAPVTNQQFSQALASQLNRPLLLPLPAKLLSVLLGEMAELLLGSQRVLPQRLLDQQFCFAFNHLEDALRDILPST